MRELISTSKKKKKAQAGNEWSNVLPKFSQARKKPPPVVKTKIYNDVAGTDDDSAAADSDVSYDREPILIMKMTMTMILTTMIIKRYLTSMPRLGWSGNHCRFLGCCSETVGCLESKMRFK